MDIREDLNIYMQIIRLLNGDRWISVPVICRMTACIYE